MLLFVSMTEMLQKAKNNGYAVGQFNINSLLWIRPILQVAELMKSPVILASSDRMVDYLGGFQTIADTAMNMVNEYNITVPVALHLDHGQSVYRCKQAIRAGYSSVMIDGSHLSIYNNIEMTKDVVNIAHENGISVEAEVGIVGGTEDGIVGNIQYADPQECLQLVQGANVDALAAALGSVHGPYKGEPQLGFIEMEEISKLTNVPLVLHGGSGIPIHQIKKAISLGHAKINVNTECAQAWTKATHDFLMDRINENIYEPQIILKPAYKAIEEVVKEKMKLFGSNNQV